MPGKLFGKTLIETLRDKQNFENSLLFYVGQEFLILEFHYQGHQDVYQYEKETTFVHLQKMNANMNRLDL